MAFLESRHEPMTFAAICRDLESRLGDLKCLGAVLATCVDGDFVRPAKDGYVTITEEEATAIYWTATEIAARIREIDAAFNRGYSVVLKGNTNAPA